MPKTFQQWYKDKLQEFDREIEKNKNKIGEIGVFREERKWLRGIIENLQTRKAKAIDYENKLKGIECPFQGQYRADILWRLVDSDDSLNLVLI